jgi:hypothetical protein
MDIANIKCMNKKTSVPIDTVIQYFARIIFLDILYPPVEVSKSKEFSLLLNGQIIEFEIALS